MFSTNTSGGELIHYGVMGQKWGVRRYQNEDGSLTDEGRRRLGYSSKEIRKDNKIAFENGREATILGRASMKSMSRTIRDEKKLEKAYEKDPEGLKKSTKRKLKNVLIDYQSAEEIAQSYKKSLDKAKQHCDSLIEKYGKESVKGIKYSEYKNERIGSHLIVNENVTSGAEWVKAAAISGLSVAALFAGAPVAVITRPRTADEIGNQYERQIHQKYRAMNK